MDSNIQKEIFELEPSTLIVLYELVLLGHNAIYRFHSGENGLNSSITFNNQEYYYVPVAAEGFDYDKSNLSRPTLTADNTDSFFSLKSRYFKDFVGFPLKRIRTFVKFLDDTNFPNNKNPFGVATKVSFPPENYIVNKKNIESQNMIQLELCSPLEKENAFIPNRKIVFNVCQWRYRDSLGCGYNGPPKSDANGNPIVANNPNSIAEYNPNTNYSQGTAVLVKSLPETGDVDKVYIALESVQNIHPSLDRSKWVLDACPKTLKACSLRFSNFPKSNNEETNGLPFGGFPGTWQH